MMKNADPIPLNYRLPLHMGSVHHSIELEDRYYDEKSTRAMVDVSILSEIDDSDVDPHTLLEMNQ